MNFYLLTDGRTDGQKVMHMSQQCKLHRWAKQNQNFTVEKPS